MEKLIINFRNDLNSLRMYISSINDFISVENEKKSLIDVFRDEGYNLKTNEKDGKMELIIQVKSDNKHLNHPGKVKKIIQNFTHKTDRSKILINTSCIHSICIAEGLFANLVHKFYSSSNSIIDKDVEFFSLAKLEQIGSLEEAKNYIINDSVDKILVQSFKNWLKILEKEMKVITNISQEEVDNIQEIFLIRNLIVHNNSKINKTFLHRLPIAKKDFYKLDNDLQLTEEKLLSFIDSIEIFFIKILYASWKKLDYENFIKKKTFFEIAYQFNELEKTQEAITIYQMLTSEKNFPEDAHLVAQFNIWVIKKNQSLLDKKTIEAIESFDTSAKAKRFMLVKLALLNKNDDFFELLPTLLKSKEIDVGDAFDWPAFSEQRKDKRFEGIMSTFIQGETATSKKLGKSKASNKKVAKKNRILTQKKIS